jgi:ring-1,2-phenylacetyl-CoA epoxidase subunit PaaD
MANERARELRRNRTAAERRLWRKLRELKQAGFKFRQQVPIDHFIVDFACLSQRLIVEVDGGTHSTDEEVGQDARRQRYLEEEGFQLLRFWNSDVRENIDGVMDMIVDALGPSPPTPPRKGEGRPSPRGRAPHRDPMLALARQAAAAVVDPEIPVLTIEDLGVLRSVERRDGGIVVKLTPTYSGCPATLAISQAVEVALAEAGVAGARVETVLAPPWSSDDITGEGRRKLLAYGIAPPCRSGVRTLSTVGRDAIPRTDERGLTPFEERGLTPFAEESVTCPRCGATATAKVSEFGSTACKALWRCEACAEPFEAFKCL